MEKSFGGYGVKNIRILALSKKMKVIFKHVHRDDFVGKKIKIIAETRKFEAGVSTNIFQAKMKKIRQVITPSLLTYLEDELFEFAASMVLAIQSPQGPTFMDIVISTQLPVATMLHIINIRLARKVVYLQDEKDSQSR